MMQLVSGTCRFAGGVARPLDIPGDTPEMIRLAESGEPVTIVKIDGNEIHRRPITMRRSPCAT